MQYVKQVTKKPPQQVKRNIPNIKYQTWRTERFDWSTQNHKQSINIWHATWVIGQSMKKELKQKKKLEAEALISPQTVCTCNSLAEMTLQNRMLKPLQQARYYLTRRENGQRITISSMVLKHSEERVTT